MTAYDSGYLLEDEPDDDPDEDDDFDEDDEDDEEDENDEDVETWQVWVPLKVGLSLTSGTELPRLTRISSSAEAGSISAGLASY